MCPWSAGAEQTGSRARRRQKSCGDGSDSVGVVAAVGSTAADTLVTSGSCLSRRWSRSGRMAVRFRR